MRGAKNDILGMHIEKAPQNSAPANRYINAPGLTMPWLGNSYQAGRKETLRSQREIPFMVIQKPSPILTRVQRENYQRSVAGGLAILPKKGA